MIQQDHHSTQEEEKDEDEWFNVVAIGQLMTGGGECDRRGNGTTIYFLWVKISWSPPDFSYHAVALQIILSTYSSSVTA